MQTGKNSSIEILPSLVPAIKLQIKKMALIIIPIIDNAFMALI